MTKTIIFLVVMTINRRVDKPHWNTEHNVHAVTQLFYRVSIKSFPDHKHLLKITTAATKGAHIEVY